MKRKIAFTDFKQNGDSLNIDGGQKLRSSQVRRMGLPMNKLDTVPFQLCGP